MEGKSKWFVEGEKLAEQGRKRWIGWQNGMFESLKTESAKRRAADLVNQGIRFTRRRMGLSDAVLRD